jgi:beta-phosphoglucomutase
MTASSKLTGALPPFRAVILDMDGLALDSESTYCHAWRLAAAESGLELSEEFCHGLFGRHADDVEKALRSVLGEAFEKERFHRSAERHWWAYLQVHGMERMPGLDALLAVLRRHAIPFALATNSDGMYARECLRLSGLESAFPVIVTRDQVPLGKPEPDLFLEAARRLEAPPALCLALEDSETGLAAARAAGTVTVLVQRRDEVRLKLRDRAFMALASLAELAELMEELGEKRGQDGLSGAGRVI